MSSLEDDSINGSVLITGSSNDYTEKTDKKLRLQDRIIEYLLSHPKATKGDILTNVSSSGTCQILVSSLIRQGIINEIHYLEIDKTKINI